MTELRSFRTRIVRAAFRRRSSVWAGFLVRQACSRASRALPVQRVGEGPHVLAFHHPMPGFEPLHVLLVPKLSVPSVMHFTDVRRQQVAAEVELLVGKVLDRLGLPHSGYLVLVNGGRRQDVRQVHFHLLTDGYELTAAPSGLPSGTWMDHPNPACEIHQVRTGPHPLLAGLTRRSGNAQRPATRTAGLLDHLGRSHDDSRQCRPPHRWGTHSMISRRSLGR